MRRYMLPLMIMMIAVFALSFAGCGDSQGSLDEETHGKIDLGMTMDDVDALAGQPERSHSIGSAQNPQVFWYYNKTAGDGFVRVVFEGGEVTTVSPYDESIAPES